VGWLKTSDLDFGNQPVNRYKSDPAKGKA